MESHLEIYVDDVSKGIRESISGGKWYGNKISVFNGIRVGILEFESPAQDCDIYNLTCFTCIKNKLLIYSFNCLVKDRSKLTNLGKQIVESIK